MSDHAGAVLTCGKDNAVKVTDSRSFQVQPTMSAPGFAVGGVWSKACLDSDERHCAAGSSTGSLFIWAVRPCKFHSDRRFHSDCKEEPLLGCTRSDDICTS